MPKTKRCAILVTIFLLDIFYADGTIASSEETSAMTRVTGQSISEEIKLIIHSVSPPKLKPDTTTTVNFVATVVGVDKSFLLDVILDKVVITTLQDSGTDGDFTAGDGLFVGTASINTNGLAIGDCLSVSVSGMQGITVVTSDPHELCISSLPLGMRPADRTISVMDPLSGQPAASDEVIIGVVPGTSDVIIRKIAADIGGVIVGSIPQIHIFQIRLQTPVFSSEELTQIINNLKGLAEVSSAEANVVDSN
ncbi:MAG: hypothetical protein COC04_06400 [Gammaproteobacteria bacterium]|nr:MAG: hypothetical protein COC04_06400 [Gammaproteobacteria bacterium]